MNKKPLTMQDKRNLSAAAGYVVLCLSTGLGALGLVTWTEVQVTHIAAALLILIYNGALVMRQR